LAPVKPDQAFLKACQQILPQYDNFETRRWVSQVLIDWGLSDYVEPVECRLEPWADLYSITMTTRWNRPIGLVWEESPFQAEEGQELVLFKSLRYTPALLKSWLAKFDLTASQETVFESGEEGIWEVCRV
jgi:L-histidine N-alpha-methyltransferase